MQKINITSQILSQNLKLLYKPKRKSPLLSPRISDSRHKSSCHIFSSLVHNRKKVLSRISQIISIYRATSRERQEITHIKKSKKIRSRKNCKSSDIVQEPKMSRRKLLKRKPSIFHYRPVSYVQNDKNKLSEENSVELSMSIKPWEIYD